MADDMVYKTLDNIADTVTVSVTEPIYGNEPGYGAYTVFNGGAGTGNTFTLNPYPNVTIPIPNSNTITVGTGMGATYADAGPWTTTTSAKINLSGEDADIEINGVSLWKTMQEIANRLNIMHTNPELETEWAELQELGQRYRKLEQHILDKQATWDRIKAMPAPEID